MEYVFKESVHSVVSRDKNGDLVGSKTVIKQETDENGNLKELKRHDYELNSKGEWVENNSIGNGLYIKDAKLSEDGKHVYATVTDEKPEPVQGKFKDGDILKAEYPTYNVYAAYKDNQKVYWILITSLNPGKNQFIGVDHVIDFDAVDGVVFDDLKKATRDEVFAVERFISANTGFRWDWRNKKLVRV